MQYDIKETKDGYSNAKYRKCTYTTREAPRLSSERQKHTKLSSQAGKVGLVKWFGEDIG